VEGIFPGHPRYSTMMILRMDVNQATNAGTEVDDTG
jgi:hypothetical protein